MEDITGNIAANLQAFRKERQMTLHDLAELTGVSKSMLGEIERGSSNPTITVLWKISAGLRIPISDLIYARKPESYLSHPENWRILQEGTGFSIGLIFEYSADRNFEIYHLEFAPHARFDSESHQKGVQKYVMVYEGELTITVEKEVFVLKRGDSLQFGGQHTHSYCNDGEGSARAYSMIHYPL